MLESISQSKHYRAIIAEDEAPLANLLAKSVQNLWPSLEIVDICSDGQNALSILEQNSVDIAFLDISMPFKTGIEIAEHCAQKNIPTLIVLVTAYPDYAVQAFQFNICDYLLKPLCQQRLSETIQRLQQRLQYIENEVKLQVQDNSPLQFLSVQKGVKHKIIPIDDVCYFKSDEKYVQIVTKDDYYLIRKSLVDLEQQLDSQIFWRVHRSNIININHLLHCKKTSTGRLELSFNSSSNKIIVSRKYIHKFKSL